MAVVDHDDHWTWQVPGAAAVFTSREGGTSAPPWDSLNIGLHVGDDEAAVHENRRRAAALAGLDPAMVAGVTQVHGADVWFDLHAGTDAPLPDSVRWDRGPSPIEADALVSTRAELHSRWELQTACRSRSRGAPQSRRSTPDGARSRPA